MKEKPSLWSGKHFKHRKGIPDIPLKSRPVVSTDWSDEIERLEKFFARIVLPSNPIILNTYTTITDLAGCIESGLRYVKANNGNRTFHFCLEQLQEIEMMLLPENEQEARKSELLPKPTLPDKKRVKRVKKTKANPPPVFVL